MFEQQIAIEFDRPKKGSFDLLALAIYTLMHLNNDETSLKLVSRNIRLAMSNKSRLVEG